MARFGNLLAVTLSIITLTCCSNRNADIDIPKEQNKDEQKGLSVVKVTKVARMTGKPVAGENIPSPNNTARDYDIGGTDLGIYWKMGEGKAIYATPLFGNTKDQMYAEPTLIYHDYFQKWITVYYNEIKNRIVLRSADELTGPWSDEQLVASGAQYPMPYGGFIYPLNLDKPEIYISLSQYDPLYNVFLMRVELKEK